MSSRGPRASETLSVRPVVTISVLLVNAIWYNFVFVISSDQLDFGSKFLCIIMDRLPSETQEQLKKMSFSRLAVKLGKAGFDPDRLERLERADLLEAVAETILVEPSAESETDFIRKAREALQVPLIALDFSGIASGTTSEGGSAAVRLRELELEKKRAERQERQAEREAEERKAAREAEERKAAWEAQRFALEAEKRREQRAMEAKERRRELKVTVDREQAERDARLKAEQFKRKHEISFVELKARQAKPGNSEGVDGQTPSVPSGAGNLALQTKRFGEMMRQVLPKMSLKSAELLSIF